MKNLYEVCIIHSMKSLGLSISKIARLAGCDRKIVRKFLAQNPAVPDFSEQRSNHRRYLMTANTTQLWCLIEFN